MTMSGILSNIRKELDKTLFNTSAGNYFEPLVEKYLPEISLVDIKAKVVNLYYEKADVLTVTLKPGSKWNGFISGQYVEVGVKINAVNYYRNFSISSTSEQYLQQGTITLTIQKQDNGKVTGWLFEHLKIGSVVTLSKAKGDFVLPKQASSVLFIAGGSGITPFISMLHECTIEKRDAVLLYYGKSGQHIFQEKFKPLSNHSHIQIELISSNEEGRISLEQLEKYCPDFRERVSFICGPDTMNTDVQRLLTDNGVGEDHVVSEYFKAAKYISGENLKNNQAVLKIGGKRLDLQGDTSILEHLESHGVRSKYGCRMGLCKQCQCVKSNGIVYNQLTGKFSESTEEVIQICVSVPVGEVEIELSDIKK